jgi:peptidoglycan/xylan/chitin deacetylase (PgdA/CDA1 family)
MNAGRFARLVVPLLLLSGLAALTPATVFQSPIAFAQPAPSSPPPTPGTVVATAGANLRGCPRPDCPVRAVALLGERLGLTGDAENGYLPVDRGGTTGWIWSLYLATPDRGTPELRSGSPGCDRVAFIFNIGVGAETRLPILDYLDREGIAATLFPMGWWTDENPALLKRMAEMDFPIGSHGDARGELTQRGDADVSEDVRASFAKIEAVIGREPAPYFTPYAADMDERVRALIAKQGVLPVAWEVPAADYGEDATADSVYMRVVPNIFDGAIVEFHLDAPASARSTEIALPWIVDNLRAKGYRFVTIPEMAAPCPASDGTPTAPA